MQYIVSRPEVMPEVMLGKPCLAGTRIPVWLIARKLAEGETREEILAAFPQLTAEHVQAVAAYVAEGGNNEAAAR